MRFAPVLLLLVAATVTASDPPKVTEVVTPPTPRATDFRCLPAEQLQLRTEKNAWWMALDFGCQVRTPLDTSMATSATFTAGKPGAYRVAAFNSDGVSLLVVTVSGDPAPPKPIPPSDTLVSELKTAMAADKGSAADMKALAALYTLMVTEAGKPDYATAAALNDTYVRARDDMLKGALPAVRRRCGSEVASIIGMDPDAPLTDAARDKLKALYARLATAVLEAAK
jgi:hypothetical protein